MKIIWHGHAFVEIQMKKMSLVIDPFITNNPLCDVKVSDLHPDYILLTHAHQDHLGDTLALVKANPGVQVVGELEFMNYLTTQGVKNTIGLNVGGQMHLKFGDVKAVSAVHSSALEINGLPYTLGLAIGFVLKIGTKKIYFAGDTALTYDMKLLRTQKLDLAFLPIGDRFTMGIKDAIRATRFAKPVRVIPVHYNTFDTIKQDPNEFVNALPKKVGYVAQIGVPFTLDEQDNIKTE